MWECATWPYFVWMWWKWSYIFYLMKTSLLCCGFSSADTKIFQTDTERRNHEGLYICSIISQIFTGLSRLELKVLGNLGWKKNWGEHSPSFNRKASREVKILEEIQPAVKPEHTGEQLIFSYTVCMVTLSGGPVRERSFIAHINDLLLNILSVQNVCKH